MRRFGIWANGNCALLVALAISTLPAFGNPLPKTGPEMSRLPKALHRGRSFAFMPAPSRCEAAGRQEITIMCDYAAAPRAPSDDGKTTRIVLNRILISFEPTDESHMRVNLTFTNGGTTRISRAHTAYLVIDDDAGVNHVRRVLQQVDFRKIAPGQRLAFSEWLLISSFRPGHYTIYLWIPDPDPSLKFIAAHNLLLSSVGVADPQTGLNTLASFTVMP
jgi:hypothetical protein